MSTLLFDLQGSFHFQEVRATLTRIPEVLQKMREVQVVLDQKSVPLDLGIFLTAEDASYLHHYRRKEFAGVVLQLGIFERYLKRHPLPENIVGVVNSISAARVIAGQMSLEQLVEETFRAPKSKEAADTLPGLPILTGIQIPKYQIFSRTEEGYSPKSAEKADLVCVLHQLGNTEEVLEVGLSANGRRGTLEDDPSLTWVWDQVRGGPLEPLVVAN
jgi:hypothetical protein